MNDTLIINGITYRAVKEEKKPERLEGYTDGYVSSHYSLLVHMHKNDDTDTRMVELRSGEIIVSEDDVAEAWRNTFSLAPSPQQSEMFVLFLKYLGFKKEGAE